jgi:hypothetical protein
MRQRITIIIGITALALVATSAALAATLTTTATVGTGSLSLTHAATATLNSTLDGTDQTVTYSPVLNVIDSRGTGAGWNLTVSATNFSDGSGHTLAPGTITGASAVCKAGNSCTAATSSGITYPLTVNGTAAKLFNAALNTGLGKIDVTPTFAVSIPGNAYAGTYTSTVTLASVSGP